MITGLNDLSTRRLDRSLTDVRPKSEKTSHGTFVDQLSQSEKAAPNRSSSLSSKSIDKRAKTRATDSSDELTSRGNDFAGAVSTNAVPVAPPRLRTDDSVNTESVESKGQSGNQNVIASQKRTEMPAPTFGQQTAPTPPVLAEGEVVEPSLADFAPLPDEEAASAAPEAGELRGEVRKKALQDFMSTLQRDFGIPPEKIVDAFAQMSEETLKAPAEESTKAFVANLELPPPQQAQVTALYKEMVQTTGDAALNERIAGAETGVSFDVLSPREDSLRKLNQSIDDLNDVFARRGNPDPVASTPPNSQLKAQLAAEQMDAQLLRLLRNPGDGGEDSSSLMMTTAAGAGLIGSEVVKQDKKSTSAGTASDRANSTALSTSTAAALAALTGITGIGNAGESAPSLGSESSAGQGFDEGSMFNGENAATPSAESTSIAKPMPGSLEMPTQTPVKNAKTRVSTNATGEANGADTMLSSAAPASSPATLPQASSFSAGPAGMLVDRPIPSASDEQENVKELIRQAQIVLKKGGGEMRMDMKPEGMGQVRLKVSVEDGQVSIQMLTDNDAAKRLLEKGLHELKSDLAAQQLKVEHMKVDVGQELQKHLDKQGDESARQQARQQAQDFMGQMRDERQSFRQGFMESSGWRSYNQGGKRNTVEPEAPQAVAAASRAKALDRARGQGQSGSGRLDLVA